MIDVSETTQLSGINYSMRTFFYSSRVEDELIRFYTLDQQCGSGYISFFFLLYVAPKK